MRYVSMYDMVEANGKTIRENNMEKRHNLPFGALVEARWHEWHGGGACSKIHARLWIVFRGRDCDGTPLYWLGRNRIEHEPLGRPSMEDKIFGHHVGGFVESNLTLVEVTDRLAKGYDSLEWPENEK